MKAIATLRVKGSLDGSRICGSSEARQAWSTRWPSTRAAYGGPR